MPRITRFQSYVLVVAAVIVVALVQTRIGEMSLVQPWPSLAHAAVGAVLGLTIWLIARSTGTR